MDDAKFKMEVHLPCGHVLVRTHVVSSGGCRRADKTALKIASGVFGHWLLNALPRHVCELVNKDNTMGLMPVQLFEIMIEQGVDDE